MVQINSRLFTFIIRCILIGKIIDLIIENTHSIERLADRQVIIENYMDTERVGRSVAKSVTSEQERQESIKNAIYGKGW